MSTLVREEGDTSQPPGAGPGTTSPRKSGVRRDLQGIRGLGIIFIVVGHLWRWPPGVYAMLDMFFVLSGFLITGVLIDSIKKYGGISFSQFYLSRVRRLMPMAVMVVLVTMAASYLLYSSALGDTVAEDGFWALVFGVNWHFAATSTDYFADSVSSPLLHYWSLSVEEQFYLVWPALVLVAMLVAHRVRVRSRTALVVVLGTVTAVSFAYSMWHSTADPGVAYYSTLDRVWEFGIGGLIAAGRQRWARMPDWLALGMSWAATFSLVVALFLLTYGRAFPAPWGLPVVLLTGVIMMAGVERNTRGLWLLDNKPMVYLGDISYSLYLWHLPVNILLLGFIAHSSPWYYVTAIALSVGLAVASYHLVERPLRYAPALMTWRERDFFSQREPKRGIRTGLVIVATASAVSVALVVTLSGVFAPAPPATATSREYVTQDLQTPEVTLNSQQQRVVDALDSTEFPRFSPPLRRLGTDRWARTLESSLCSAFDEEPTERCNEQPQTGPRLALVVGDSFAGAWSPGIHAALEPKGWGVQDMAMGQCASWTLPSYVDLHGRPNPACSERHDEVLRAVRERDPGLVILASSSRQVLNARRKELATTAEALAHDGLSRTIRKLRAAGARRIAVVSPPPQLQDLRRCATRFGSPDTCVSEPRQSYWDHVSGESLAAEALGVDYIATEDWFCFERRCPAFVGRMPVTADGAHLSIEYSRSLAPLLRRELLRR